MRILYTLFILLSLSVILISCSSGKSAYQHGDYYQAVLEAVQRLRSKPDHKKSKEVLSLSYMAAINFIETDTQNKIKSDSNDKWRAAVQNYTRINNLYDEINRSPGALKVIPKPISRFDELKNAKQKAAEESYEMGLQAMLKNTREDSKHAYYLFKDANTFSPEYRESIELSNQAKFDATLKVVVEPITVNPTNWNFESLLYGYQQNEFVKFYSPDEAQKENLKRIDQYLKLIVQGYTESLPSISKSTQEVKDSVKTGEKKMNNITVPTYTKVAAKVTTFTKSVRGKGSMNLIVTDGSSKTEIKNIPILSEQVWSSDWVIYTGDVRALSQNLKNLSQRKEPFLSNNQLKEMVHQDLAQKLSGTLQGFYRNY